MPNYQNSKIYRLVCSETGNQYIGSTTQSLSQRKSGHKIKTNICTSKSLINPEIFLIENCPCNSKEELHKIERIYIENNECVNKFIPTRTKKEYYQDNKEYMIERVRKWNKNNKESRVIYKKEYRKLNIEKIKNNDKEYYNKNKDKLKEYQKEYREQNAEKLKQRAKAYREAHKEEISLNTKEYRKKNIEKRKEKVICECGSEITILNKARHLKTKKHQNFIKD